MSGVLGGSGGEVTRGRVLVAALDGAATDDGDVVSALPGPAPRHLRDAGLEVVVAGLLPTAPAVVAAARDEDVDAVLLLAAGEGGPAEGVAVVAGLADQGLDVPVVVVAAGPAPGARSVEVLTPDAPAAEVVAAVVRAISGDGAR